MSTAAKQRIEVTVDRTHVATIRSCLRQVPHDDFSVRPVMSGWTTRGYWSSDQAFGQIGSRVEIGFTVDPNEIAPLLANGFGIIANGIVPIRVSQPTAGTLD